MVRDSWAIAEAPSGRKARRNSRKPVEEFIMLEFDRHRSVDRIDKPDASIERIHSTAVLPLEWIRWADRVVWRYPWMPGAATGISLKTEVPGMDLSEHRFDGWPDPWH
jgi:hypothetical protein